MENLVALILGIIDVLVAVGLLVWGILGHIWYLIVLGAALLILPFIVWIVAAANGW